jgi:hypothetical protein
MRYYIPGLKLRMAMYYKVKDTAPLDAPIFGAEVLQGDDPRLFALDQNLLQAQFDIEDQGLTDAYRRREEELENLFHEFLHLGRLESISAVNCGLITNPGDDRQDAISENEGTSQDVPRGSVFVRKEMIHD